MDIIIWIIFGAIAGYVASLIMKSNNSVLEDIVLGIVGAFVGGFIMNTFGQTGVTGFNIYSLLVAIVGSVVLIFLGRALHRS